MEVLSGGVLEANIQNKITDKVSPINSPLKIVQNIASDENSYSSDEEKINYSVKRVQRLSDSDSSQSVDNFIAKSNSSAVVLAQTFSSDEEENQTPNITHQRSRIRNLSNESDSDDLKLPDSIQNEKTESRTETKRNNLKNKFKHVVKGNNNLYSRKSNGSNYSADSDDDLNSIEKIKQTIKERNQHLKSTLYDPDTSDEGTTQNKQQEKIYKMKKKGKSTKLISPKPMRMTAKDAMENMQKIKSESNRMLREKEVSLPYHRPKALSLKDIMSKRRPPVAADGKALPIKMNEEQLKHYIKILEERQKEVIQLCKSDTEEEDDPEHEKNINNDIEIDTDKVSNMDVDANSETVNKTLETTSDDLYDDLKSNLDQQTSLEINQDNENKVLNDKIEVESQDSDQIVLDKTKNDQVCSELTETDLNTESDSQLVLYYTENTHDQNTEVLINYSVTNHDTYEGNINNESEINKDKEITSPVIEEDKDNNAFSDADIDMEYIDAIIENAEILEDVSVSSVSENPLNVKPKLTGAPGTVIDLDDTNATGPKNLSGVELLKERYIFFSKLKTPEEMEREKEKRIKPGTLHLKLKQELEEKMAEQRSLEWSKRLEEEKAQHMETDAVMNDQEEDDIEKLEAKLEQSAEIDPDDAEEPESEEELVEDDCDMEDKPRKRNTMLDDEAEESDDEDAAPLDGNVKQANEDEEVEADDESEESSDESSASEDDQEQNKPKKGRILKAFEDSDDEDEKQKENKEDAEDHFKEVTENSSPVLQIKSSQDDELQLAQVQRSFSEDLFPSQSSGKTNTEKNMLNTSLTGNQNVDKIEDTQSFSIMDSNTKDIVNLDDNFTCETQDDKIEPEVAELLGNLPQNLEQSQLPTSQTQGFGDDVLALCTGNFYDNKFVSQTEPTDSPDKKTQEIDNTDLADTNIVESQLNGSETASKQKIESCDILKSILDELDSPEFEKPKQNKFFTGNTGQDQDNRDNVIKKKFVIDSDDEVNEIVESKKINRKKKKRMENRALQISDDEDEECEDEEDEYESELDDDNDEKIVEYDSEENEVITSHIQLKPKKKAVTDFFEDEAELSSNEEWSGDEDERGLDRMEREEGDQDHFHQARLQRELGVIHMREVLDQDKREVRIIQELLFEDGDLGDGHRQRRFRWKNIDGEEGDFTTMPALATSQDDDFEMEEQWRKERYEREVFLKKMRENAKQDIEISEIPLFDENMKVNITTVATSSELKNSEAEKRTIKDVPSPRKPLGAFQSTCRGSLLSRGGSSLSRLAALAAPLVDSENSSSVAAASRNFVFAALSQSDKPKVTKRKANNEGTPKLMKKLKSEQNTLKNSLLDHLNP